MNNDFCPVGENRLEPVDRQHGVGPAGRRIQDAFEPRIQS